MMRGKGTGGFSLPLLLIIAALIVVILVAFAAVVRVETQVAENFKKTEEARLQALYGLNLALGRLQEAAGRDQSVTARAEILEGRESINAGNRYWTGVWDVRDDHPFDYAAGFRDANGRIDGTKRKPVWLISSENGDPSPSQPVSALSAFGTVSLVGTNTWTNRVEAGLVETQDGGQTKLKKAYAYWVGDEGIKARCNVPMPQTNSLHVRRHDFLAAQRAAIENISGLSQYPATNSRLKQVIRTGQLARLQVDPAALRSGYFDLTPFSRGVISDSARGGLKRDLTYAFSLSNTDFQNLLTSGRMPSYYLPQGLYGDSAGAHRITAFTEGYRNLITSDEVAVPAGGTGPSSPARYAVVFPWERGPTWERLRSFFNLQHMEEDGRVSAAKAELDQEGVYPIITGVIMKFHPGIGPPGTGTRNGRVYLDVQVVLWNPFNVTLEPPSSPDHDYVFVCVFGQNPVGLTYEQRPANSGAAWTPDVTIAPYKGNPTLVCNGEFPAARISPENGYGTFPRYSPFVFKIKGAILKPGESRVFSIAQSMDGQPYSTNPSNPVNNILTADQDYQDRGLLYYEPGGAGSSVAPIVIPDGFESRVVQMGTGGGGQLYTIGLRSDLPAVSGQYQIFNDYYYQIKCIGMPVIDNIDQRRTPAKVMSDIFPGQAGYVEESICFQFEAADAGGRQTVSTVPAPRWLAMHDPRAPYQVQDPGADISQRPATIFFNTCSWAHSLWPEYPQFHTNEGTSTTYYGSGRDAGTGVESAILFEIPRAESGLISLGALQHAQMNSLSFQPAYVFGSSLANPNLHSGNGAAALDWLMLKSRIPEVPDYVDLPYFVNQALWDGFFFSTVPSTLTGEELRQPEFILPNSLLVPITQEPSKLVSLDSASNLLVRGGFNINSTSVEAWKSILSSLNGIRFNPVDGGSAVVLQNPFSRLGFPAGSSSSGGGASVPFPNDWNGYREFSTAQISSLADAIVSQIKSRGPFVSLAHFVNRQLSSNPSFGSMGALEAAIGATQINQDISGRSFPDGNASIAGSPRFTLSGYASVLLLADKLYSGPRHWGATGWLTQGDILQALAPVLSARSDTFTIRAYGEISSAGAAGAPRRIVAKAICEATVQRMPEFVDPSNSPETPPLIQDPSVVRQEEKLIDNPAMTEINRNLGRRFRVISFRWLNDNEI